MTKDEIIAMAKEAGIEFEPQQALSGELMLFTEGSLSIDRMGRFAAVIAAKEREACADLVQLGPPPVTGFGSRVEIGFGARTAYAAAIRARGQKEGAL